MQAPWWRARSLATVGVAAALLAGCHIHNTNPAPSAPTGSVPTGIPTGIAGLPDADASVPITISPGGGNIGLSSFGVGGTLQYAANNAVSVAGTFTLTTIAPANAPTTSGTQLVYFQTQLGSSVTFNAPLFVSPVVFPSSFPTTGLSFSESFYDGSGTLIGSPLSGVVNGQSVTFPTPTGSFTASSGQTYLTVVTSP